MCELKDCKNYYTTKFYRDGEFHDEGCILSAGTDINCKSYDPCAKRDERDLKGKICIFNTNGMDSELKIYDRELCIVKDRIDEDTYDFEDVGTMYNVRLIGEHRDIEIEVFADEIEGLQEVETYSFL